MIPEGVRNGRARAKERKLHHLCSSRPCCRGRIQHFSVHKVCPPIRSSYLLRQMQGALANDGSGGKSSFRENRNRNRVEAGGRCHALSDGMSILHGRRTSSDHLSHRKSRSHYARDRLIALFYLQK